MHPTAHLLFHVSWLWFLISDLIRHHLRLPENHRITTNWELEIPYVGRNFRTVDWSKQDTRCLDSDFPHRSFKNTIPSPGPLLVWLATYGGSPLLARSVGSNPHAQFENNPGMKSPTPHCERELLTPASKQGRTTQTCTVGPPRNKTSECGRLHHNLSADTAMENLRPENSNSLSLSCGGRRATN